MWLDENYELTDEIKVFTVKVNVYVKEGKINNKKESISFIEDDWNAIINAVKKNKTDAYKVGDTKTIDMGNIGTHTLRIANKSTPDECNRKEFSQTAFGFVIEFADYIAYRPFYNILYNKGCWPENDMRTYLSTEILSKFPSDLKNGIIDTYTVSGHGPNEGKSNFISEDKIYLFGAHEVLKNGESKIISNNDTIYNLTRQLDYYFLNNVITDLPSLSAIVKLPYHTWWLRTSSNNLNCYYIGILDGRPWTDVNANMNFGVLPAFRIRIG